MPPPTRVADLWEVHPLQPSSPSRSKLRLMCSSGGHIVPRPHDKALCYLGGETRIITVDRRQTLSDLHSRLSRSFLQNHSFSIKYQLPSEDLDSLVSLSTDDDLENMIEEHDGLADARVSPRLRLFLFPSGKNTSNSPCISSLLEDAKSESWFVDALNGGAPRRNPSSGGSSVNCLLGLDDLNQLSTPLPAQQPDENPNPNPDLLDSPAGPDPMQEIAMHVKDQSSVMNQVPQQQFVNPPPPHLHHLPPLSSYFQIPIHPQQNVPMYYMPVAQPPQFVGYPPLQQHSAAGSGYGFEFMQNGGSS